MISDLQFWITIISILVALTSLAVSIYNYQKSEPTRIIGRIQVNKERARLRLTSIADALRTWENEMQEAESKNEKFDLSKSNASHAGITGLAIGWLAETFSEAYSTYPNFVTRGFFDLILKDVKVENGMIVQVSTFFESRQNILRARHEIDQIIATL